MTIELSMVVYSSVIGIVIIRKWDLNSSSEAQLVLERKTYLLSTVMNYVLAFSIFATFLFNTFANVHLHSSINRPDTGGHW